MAATVDHHGGGCCGRFHVWNFSDYNMVKNLASIKGYLEHENENCGGEGGDYLEDDTKSGMCCEITLNEDQVGIKHEGKTFMTHLEDMGFEDVYQFGNPNSGNVVHVFLYSSNKV